jgi:hypothetical protein
VPFPGDLAQRFRIRGTEEQVVVSKQLTEPRKHIFASVQVSFEQHGASGERKIAIGAPVAMLCGIHIMFVGREYFSGGHNFAETP